MAATATIRDYASLVRFSHTVFALPFGLISLLVATGGAPGWSLLAKIVAAMVLARSAAMGFNRWADRHLDAANPRTAGREIPSGVISARAALAFTLVCSIGFVLVAAWIQPLCAALAVPVLAVLLGYSYAKRLTAAVHLWLGVALGLAAPAAWVAATGTIDASILSSLVLGLGVTVWVAGFDILYACQDESFDRDAGLRSLPVALGPRGALRAARVLHGLAVIGFAGFGLLTPLGVPWFVGVGLVTCALAYEHRLVRADDLERIDMAFFTMNGAVSLALLLATLVDLYWF